MITEDYVSLEVAQLLKEKGFDEPTLYHYLDGNGITTCNIDYKPYRNSKLQNGCNAPTLQMAMKWLREDHHIHILPQISDPSQVNPKYYIVIWTTGPKRESYILELFNSYEEAVEEGIKYCLENLI